MVNLLKGSGRIALQQGLLFGIILAVLIITLNSIVSLTGLSIQLTLSFNRSGHMSANQAAQMASFLVSAPAYVLSVVLYFITGWRASKLAGKATMGALAGLLMAVVAGVLVGIIDIGFLLLVTLPAIAREYSANHLPVSSSYAGSLLRSTISSSVITLLLTMVLGAGIGMLGGLLGQDQSGRPGGEQDEQEETTQAPPYNDTAEQPG
ncbi:MAG TPA: hypothetical protein VH593_31490 [Ktedonobacteraceae bacterium]|jgi:hypothetical protein